MSPVLVHADGASRGNPGDAAGGAVVIAHDGQIVAQLGIRCGVASNNVAEYRGMIEALRLLRQWDNDEPVLVRLDSKLVVEQMSGRWKVKHPDMRDLVREAFDLIGPMQVTFEWVPRAENALADAAANKALDEQRDYLIVRGHEQQL